MRRFPVLLVLGNSLLVAMLAGCAGGLPTSVAHSSQNAPALLEGLEVGPPARIASGRSRMAPGSKTSPLLYVSNRGQAR